MKTDTKNAGAEILEVEVQGQAFSFEVTREAYNRYINSITPKDKVNPSHNFLIMTAQDGCKAALVQFLKETPGSEVSLAGSLLESYTPDLDIVVKKRKP